MSVIKLTEGYFQDCPLLLLTVIGVGVALGEQLVDHVVAGKHDVVVDYVVVPEGVVRVSM